MKDDYQYVVNAQGETTGVLLSPKAFEAYEEYMIDEAIAQAARDSKGELGIPLEEVMAELRAAGEIDVWRRRPDTGEKADQSIRPKREEPGFGSACSADARPASYGLRQNKVGRWSLAYPCR